MIINEIIEKLDYFIRVYKIDSLFLCGQTPRFIYDNSWNNIDKIEVVSYYGDQSIQLGNLFATEILKTKCKINKELKSIYINYSSKNGEIRIEFQGYSTNKYMQNEEVLIWMRKNHIHNIPVFNNIYGRSFTINGLTYSVSNHNLYDITGRATVDFERKNISSILPAYLLIKYNPSAILQAIKLSLKYDFHINEELREAMENGYKKISKSLPKEKILKEIVDILKIGKEDGLKMLKQFNLDGFILNPTIKEFI